MAYFSLSVLLTVMQKIIEISRIYTATFLWAIVYASGWSRKLRGAIAHHPDDHMHDFSINKTSADRTSIYDKHFNEKHYLTLEKH